MDTILGICALLGMLVLFDILQNNRRFTLGLFIAGIGALALYSAFPDVAATIFGHAVFAGSAAVEVALSLFIWAAPFLLLWLFFTLAIHTLSGGR
jgi:hypothetical protein